MRIYPAIKAQMGDWNYYIVRMKMREIATEVQLAHDIYEDQTLSDAIQRTLGESRVKKDIVGFLSRRKDRFFSSIVVAAMEGDPSWHPVEMDPQVVPSIFSHSTSLREGFGVLSFGDEPKYYALDGQHRVAAIRLLVNREVDDKPPENFDNDMLAVIVVLREEHDVPEGEWMRRYRRLFSSLNRYAKATDKDTNIIMDEDDLFAILTRRLITEHEFFQAPGREKESFKVQTKGKNLKKGATYFTTLQTLYEITGILLKTRERATKGWKGWLPDGEMKEINKQVCPDEEYVDKYYEELSNYWNAILEVFPDLYKQPTSMRQHDIESNNESGGEDLQDHLLFWPIGQELFAHLVRALLDKKYPEGGFSGVKQMVAVLNPLSRVPWDLHKAPWRHLILVKSGASWRMRSEDRRPAIHVAERLLRWFMNLDSLDQDKLENLYEDWEALLYIGYEEGEPKKMWNEIKNACGQITV